jgi:DNA processing protein
VEIVTVPLRIEARSESWPDLLRHIDGPPEALWVRGRLSLLARTPRVAVVGTRAPTPYGEMQAARFAATLARAGVTVVSGLARGIDQAAHRAALEQEGSTIAVLGCGVDRPWPPGEAADDVAARGLLLSEFEPGQPPRPHHFPLRNRVISGLCCGVLVVEAAQASGSLITARWAADQGRSVWALPGRVDHPMSRGTHRLIREGASLVESPEEILAEIGLGSEAQEPSGPAPGSAERHAEITGALRGETLTAEELALRLSKSLATILVQVVELEMAGRIARTPGGLYRLVR